MLKFLQSLLVLTAILIAILVSWPSLLGLQREMYFAQAVSARGFLIGVSIIMLLLLIVLAMAIPRFRSFATSLGLVLILFGAFNTLVLFNQGWNNAELTELQHSHNQEITDTQEITVLAWNTLGDEPGADQIARLAIESNAQIISLPETTRAVVEEVSRQLQQAGMPMQIFHRALNQSAPAKSTGLLVSTTLGPYHLVEHSGDTSQLPSLIAQSESGPKIVAVHAVAPLPPYFEAWNNDLHWLAAQCNSPNTILAGDFNATVDHFIGLGTSGGQLGYCTDSAEQLGAAGHGTWPTNLPSQISLPIDHIMTGDAWEPIAFRTVTELDHTGSDHRPIIVRLTQK